MGGNTRASAWWAPNAPDLEAGMRHEAASRAALSSSGRLGRSGAPRPLGAPLCGPSARPGGRSPRPSRDPAARPRALCYRQCRIGGISRRLVGPYAARGPGATRDPQPGRMAPFPLRGPLPFGPSSVGRRPAGTRRRLMGRYPSRPSAGRRRALHHAEQVIDVPRDVEGGDTRTAAIGTHLGGEVVAVTDAG